MMEQKKIVPNTTDRSLKGMIELHYILTFAASFCNKKAPIANIRCPLAGYILPVSTIIIPAVTVC